MSTRRPHREGHTGLLSAGQIWSKLFRLCGLDAHRIWQEAGAASPVSEDPNTRVPLHFLDAAVLLAASRISNPAWALNMAQCWHPGNLGVLGHAWLASSTLRTGLTRLDRYWKIVTTRAAVQLLESDAGLRFVYRLPTENPVISAVFPDGVFSVLMDMCRVNSGDRMNPLQVTLRRPQPADNSPWINCFGCPVFFGAPENSMTFSGADLDRVLPTANRPLAGTLDRLLLETLSALDRDDIESRCKAAVLNELSTGEPAAPDIAQKLNLSGRTLQRRLAAVNTSYLKLVDETRRDLALRYIADRDKSVSEITFLLGFSGQSAFTRAFRRWTGRTPTEFRQQAR